MNDWYFMCEEEKCEHTWETKRRAEEGADDAFTYSRGTKWNYDGTSSATRLAAPAVIFNQCSRNPDLEDSEHSWCNLIPDCPHFSFALMPRVIFAKRNSPTLPEISSFPRKSRKSVTLSRTATLQRERKEKKNTDQWRVYTIILHVFLEISQIWTAIYLITFLIRRKKASLDEVQKFFPYIAICRWGEMFNNNLTESLQKRQFASSPWCTHSC